MLTIEQVGNRITYANSILSIAKACEKSNIPYEIHELYEGYQITFPWCEGDIVAHAAVYGAENDQVESMHFPWDRDDVSAMSTDAMIALIFAYYLLKDYM